MSVEAADNLAAFAAALSVERRSGAIVERLVEAAVRLGRADGAAALTGEPGARRLQPAYGIFRGRALPARGAVQLGPVEADGGRRDPCAHALACRRIVFVPDARAADGPHDLSRLGGRGGGILPDEVTALAAVPLLAPDAGGLGVLLLFDPRGPDGHPLAYLDAETARLLEALASLAAAGIENARLAAAGGAARREAPPAHAASDAANVSIHPLGRRRPEVVAGLIGRSPAMERVFHLVERAADSKVPVLVLGETGTGKELVARAIHQASARRKASFVPQNCAALPEALLESELFGFRKGAFTGADADTRGLVHEADGGTLFLDEIGDMPPGMQAKVLRLLQEGEVRPVGARKAETVDIRIVAATHVDLKEGIARGTFREDLYYRLGVFPIHLPPLRERPSDIPLLIEHFLKTCAATYGRRHAAFSPEALDALFKWRYPGNVRELRNAVERAVLLSDDGVVMGLDVLPPEIGGVTRGPAQGQLPEAGAPELDGSLKTIMRRYERLVLEAKLMEVGWNQSEAAERLGISRRSMVDKIGIHRLRRPRASGRRGRGGRQADTHER